MDHKKSYLLNGRNEGRIDIPAFDEVALLKKQGRIHDTLSRGGWAGAVMWWAVMGSEECRIHDSISNMQLGRSSNAKTARETLKTLQKHRRDGQTDRPTDTNGPTDRHSDL